MTLTSLLEIDLKLLAYDDERSLRLAELVWKRRGSPCDRESLTVTLEAILQHLQSEGIYYPKVFLLRKKQLQRGVWTPKSGAANNPQVISGQIQWDKTLCEHCGGTGIRNLPNNSGTFCECAAGNEFRLGKRKNWPTSEQFGAKNSQI